MKMFRKIILAVCNLLELFMKRAFFKQSGIHPSAVNNFAVHLLAQEAGHVTVKLRIIPSNSKCIQTKHNKTLIDEIQIQVSYKAC